MDRYITATYIAAGCSAAGDNKLKPAHNTDSRPHITQTEGYTEGRPKRAHNTDKLPHIVHQKPAHKTSTK